MQLSAAEWKVMNAVWKKHPVCVREVLERLESDTTWAYTTVKTMLTRLVEKGVLRAERQGNTLFYSPVLTQQQARRSAVQTLMNRAFDGAFAPLLQFLLSDQKLSDRERQRLAEIVRQESSTQE